MAQDLTKYYEALQKADSSGDEKAAREIAEYIKSVQSKETAPSFAEKLLSPGSEAFLSKLVNSLAFGIPEMLDVKTRPERKEVYERAEQEYPAQTLAGDIAGMVPMTAAGGVGGWRLAGKAVEKGAEKVSKKAGEKAAEQVERQVTKGKDVSGLPMDKQVEAIASSYAENPNVLRNVIQPEMNLARRQAEAQSRNQLLSALGMAGRYGIKGIGGLTGAQGGAAMTSLFGEPGSSIMRSQMAGETIKTPLGLVPGSRQILDPVSQLVPGSLLLGSQLFGPRPYED